MLRPVLILLTLALQAQLLVAQQAVEVTMLKGQGRPENVTTDIYVNVYIDRMLKIDDLEYRHEEIFSFYITWYDPTAARKIAEATAASLDPNSSYTCSRPCSNSYDFSQCCDQIYIPTFMFRNLVEFPTERPYSIAPQDNNGSMMWNAYVHCVNYQRLDFHHFPFDNFDLVVVMQFIDTGTADHPGVTLHTSAGAPEMLSIGTGDALSEWSVNSINITVFTFPLGNWFSKFSTIRSNPNDYVQLAGVNGTQPSIARVQTQWVVVKINVERFTTYQILNTILPVSICAFLGLMVFFVPMRDLHARLELVIVLFLALTAIQFVLTDSQPASSYVVPTQQFILATYCLFAAIALESVLVHHMCVAKDRAERTSAHKDARSRVQRAIHLQRQSTLPRTRAPTAANSTKGGFTEKLANCLGRRGAGGGGDAAGNEDQRIRDAAAAAVAGMNSGLNGEHDNNDDENSNDNMSFNDNTPSSLLRRRPSDKTKLGQQLKDNTLLNWWKAASYDEQYAEDLAERIDAVCIISLAVAYVIAAVLIFTLQEGYINQFNPTYVPSTTG